MLLLLLFHFWSFITLFSFRLPHFALYSDYCCLVSLLPLIYTFFLFLYLLFDIDVFCCNFLFLLLLRKKMKKKTVNEEMHNLSFRAEVNTQLEPRCESSYYDNPVFFFFWRAITHSAQPNSTWSLRADISTKTPLLSSFFFLLSPHLILPLSPFLLLF